MNNQIKQAFSLLNIDNQDFIHGLLDNLYIGGYFAPELINKAITYLAADKPFAVPKEQVISDLQQSLENCKNGETIAHEFAKHNYLTPIDVLEIILFLTQTAFDRQYGQERDTLTAKSWMETDGERFLNNFHAMGLVAEKQPASKQDQNLSTLYIVMGAAWSRFESRMQFLSSQIDIESTKDNVHVCAGERELSLGLEDAETIVAIANHFGINFEKDDTDKPVFHKGLHNKDYLKSDIPVTETHMGLYLLHLNGFSNSNTDDINVMNSAAKADGSRPTTRSNAYDLAQMIISKELFKSPCNINIIAEQPYDVRMAMEVKAIICKELLKAEINPEHIQVEAWSKAIDVEFMAGLEPKERASHIARLNSSQGALLNVMRETQVPTSKLCRNPHSYLCSRRDEHHKKTLANNVTPSQLEIEAESKLAACSIMRK